MARHGSHRLLDGYREMIIRSYGSMEATSYTFVSDAIKRRPYAKLLTEIGRYGRVEDCSYWDDDVAYRLAVETQVAGWVLWLSLVGPYAVIHGGWSSGRPPGCSTLYQPGATVSADVVPIVEAVAEAGFKFLGVEELLRPIEFTPINGSPPVPLFRALFTDEEEAFEFLSI